jgi:hypothetical protein
MVFPVRLGLGYKWATVKLHDGAGKAHCSVFTRVRDRYFLGHMVVAKLLEIASRDSRRLGWARSAALPQGLRYEDIQISFRKKTGG